MACPTPRSCPGYMEDPNLLFFRVVGRAKGLHGYPGMPDAPELTLHALWMRSILLSDVQMKGRGRGEGRKPANPR